MAKNKFFNFIKNKFTNYSTVEKLLTIFHSFSKAILNFIFGVLLIYAIFITCRLIFLLIFPSLYFYQSSPIILMLTIICLAVLMRFIKNRPFYHKIIILPSLLLLTYIILIRVFILNDTYKYFSIEYGRNYLKSP